MSNTKKTQLALIVQHFSKKDLFIHMLSALKHESFYYASILRDEIMNRPFSEKEKQLIRQSSFYPQLNGLWD